MKKGGIFIRKIVLIVVFSSFTINTMCFNYVQSNVLQENTHLIQNEFNEESIDQITQEQNQFEQEQEKQNNENQSIKVRNEPEQHEEKKETLKEIRQEKSKEEEQEDVIEMPKEEQERVIEEPKKEEQEIVIKEPKEEKPDIQEELKIQKTVEKLQDETTLKANRATPFNSNQGFFLIHIKGEGKETIRRINVYLTSVNRGSSQTIYFEEKDTNGYVDNYNFQILTTSAKTMPTEQNSYAVFSFQFSYTKPAHLKASHWYSDKTGNERFNFNKSPTDSTTTINNTGHNAYDTTEVINMQINLANCGIAALEVKHTNATGHIELNRDYYSVLNIDPNGRST